MILLWSKVFRMLHDSPVQLLKLIVTHRFILYPCCWFRLVEHLGRCSTWSTPQACYCSAFHLAIAVDDMYLPYLSIDST